MPDLLNENSILKRRCIKAVLGVVIFVWFAGVGAHGESRLSHVFPQFADGSFSDGTYFRSTLLVTNDSPSRLSSPAKCIFGMQGLRPQRITDRTGAVVGNDQRDLPPPLPGQTRVSFTVSPLGWEILQSSAIAPFSQGFAALECNTTVYAQVLYAYYNQAGLKLSEATVFSSDLSSIETFIIDHREGARLGIAIANLADANSDIDVVVRDLGGALVGTARIRLPPLSNTAKFVDELLPLPLGFVGKMILAWRTALGGYTIGLRFTGAAFTTVLPAPCYGTIQSCTELNLLPR